MFFSWRADMLPGLQEGQEKMSKSDPSSSIYMEDEEVLSDFTSRLSSYIYLSPVIQWDKCCWVEC